MIWTEEKISKLRAAWESGGASAIMETFGVSRKRADELRRTYLRIRMGLDRRGRTHRWTQEFADKIRMWLKAGGIEKVMQETGWTRDYALETTRRAKLRKINTYHVVQSNDLIDKLIKNAYEKKQRGAIREMARKNGLDYGWVKNRARVLGITIPKRNPEWSETEKLILESLTGSTTETIQKELKARGFYRSLEAIDSRMSILGLNRTHEEGMNASEVAKIFGVNAKSVSRWLKACVMQGKYKSYTGHRQYGDEPYQWFVTPADVKKFIKTQRSRYNLKVVNQELFLAIIFDNWHQTVILPNQDDEEYTNAASGNE